MKTEIFDKYKLWGLKGNLDIHHIEFDEKIIIGKINILLNKINVDLSEYKLKKFKQAYHYQGENVDEKQVYWLRFEKSEKEEKGNKNNI